MAVPYTFATATSTLPLSQLDANFATPITLGSTAITLGSTASTLTGVSITGNAGTVTNGVVTTGSYSNPSWITSLNANKVAYTAYTVATLPTGTQGQRAFVTDATAPVFLTTVVGGGAVVCPVFFDGTNWVAG